MTVDGVPIMAGTASLVSSLPIDRIETIPVIAPLGRVFQGSHYRMTHRATLIVRVYAGGLVGEAYAGDEDKNLHQIDGVVANEIAPRLLGHDASRVELCHKRSWPVTFDILRDRRISLVAVACVDAAIWDLVGKALNQPLWRLWGGFRNRLPQIMIGGYYDDRPPEALADDVHEYMSMGMSGVKLKVGGLHPQADARRVEIVREAAGADFIITIDANQGFQTREAIDLCRRVADLDVTWFEEPVRWQNDARSLRDVRYVGGLPVCAGQTEFTIAGCRDLMEHGAIDVCNFDSSWSGGPTAWLRSAALAHAYDVKMAHHEEPHIASHLLASQQHSTYVECFHPDRDPFWWQLIVERPPIVAGEMVLGDAPGLGWRLDEDYISAHRAEDQ